jgi:hypothetical protein
MSNAAQSPSTPNSGGSTLSTRFNSGQYAVLSVARSVPFAGPTVSFSTWYFMTAADMAALSTINARMATCVNW